jgi:hypothetical protein
MIRRKAVLQTMIRREAGLQTAGHSHEFFFVSRSFRRLF